MLSFDDALTRILAAVPQPAPEKLHIENAMFRVLAAPVIAGHDQPPFTASAMDGYAVHASSIATGQSYAVAGESQAGTGLNTALQPGEVARIFTGAPLPEGADAVIIQEDAERNGDNVQFSVAASSGENVRRQGLDFAQGNALLQPGTLLGPAASALTAASNVDEVQVYQRPKLAFLSTGDELLPPGSTLNPGQIIGSNGFALKPLFSPYIDSFTDLGNAPDDEAALRAMFEKALNSEAQFIISSGGASVGDHDLVQPVLKSLGVDVDFWKIAMRPGKPLMFGQWQDKLLFALPGNPVSSFVTALMLVVPALRASNGFADPHSRALRLPLASSLSANGARRHFIRARLVEVDGRSMAEPFSQTDSAHLSTLAAADLLIVHPESSPELAAGEVVTAIPIPSGN